MSSIRNSSCIPIVRIRRRGVRKFTDPVNIELYFSNPFIVGGVGSFPGIALAALLLGMAQHFGAWFIGSQWQDAIAFIILIVFLLFKPEGFMGKKVKAATV